MRGICMAWLLRPVLPRGVYVYNTDLVQHVATANATVQTSTVARYLSDVYRCIKMYIAASRVFVGSGPNS